jgi:hypothetical protein
VAVRTLTAANSVLLLTIPGLFNSPQRIQGFATDDAFDTEAVEPAETMMGVDGVLSAGYVPVPYKMTIVLQGDSASNNLFDTWAQSQKIAREVLRVSGNITLVSVGRTYALTRGILTSYKPMSGVKKVLQSRSYGITWEDVSPAPR